MENVLVIIDMQYHFEASRGKAIQQEHIKQINKAKKNKHTIVVIEYKDSGKTLPKLLESLKGYENVHFLTKNTCSGSGQLVAFFKKKKVWPKQVNFMGVNTGACVGDTVVNFHKHIKKNEKQTKIAIIKEGCRCGDSKTYGNFNRFENLGVKVK